MWIHRALAAATVLTLARAQTFEPSEAQHLDVVYTNDGSVWRGLIVEQVPGRFYRVALSGGSIVRVDADKVQRIAKEPNPSFVAPSPPAAAYGPSASAPPEPTAAAVRNEPEPSPRHSRWIEPGPRFSLATGVAIPTGDLGEDDFVGISPLVTVRLGGETIAGPIGITPAFRADYIYWLLDTTQDVSYHFLHAGVDVRLALRLAQLRRLAPYVSLGLGADLSMSTGGESVDGKGFGMGVGFGTDVLLSPGFALGLAFTLHPGFAKTVDEVGVDVTYLGVGLALATY